MRINVSGVKQTTSLTTANPGRDLDVGLSFSADFRQVIADVTQSWCGHPLSSQTLQEKAAGIPEIAFISNGGAGMDGLHGQNGAPGSPGRDGADATEYSRGEDGGRGGPGGDGTPGTSGGPGGAGGDITLKVAQDETDILSAVMIENFGGRGGDPGVHGRGGPGGRGGRGGASRSWTTTVYERVQKERTWYETVWENGQSRSVERREHYYVDEPRTVSHYMAGGMDGSRGPDGWTPTTPLYRGQSGRDGRLLIEVKSPSGIVRTYHGVYKPTLTSFKSTSSTDNGIYEPGDTIEVSNIEICNAGEMPTPRGKLIRVSVVTDAAMSSNTQQICLLDEIPAKSSVILGGRLFFTLKEYTGDGSSPLASNMAINLTAMTPRLQRTFSSFSNPRTVTLSHPVQLGEAYYPRALVAGEYTRLAFAIKNMSLKEIGRDATLKALQREIQLACGVGSPDVSGGKLVFCDAYGRTISAPRHFFSVSKIDANALALVSCYVKVENNKEAHASHDVRAELRLQKIGSIGELKHIDTRTAEIKEGVPYAPGAQDDFLLVTNADTTAQELRAWRDIAQELGLSFSIWDTSLYHHMRLNEEPPVGDKGSSLLKRWRGKLMVVLNQWDNTHGEPIAPLDFISQKEFDEALRHNNMRVYTVGAPMAAEQRPSLMEEIPLDGKRFYDSVAHFQKAPDKEILSSKYAHVVTITRTAIKGIAAPADTYFKKLVEHIRRDLDKRFPDATFMIIPEFTHSVTKKWPGSLAQSEQLGRIEIQCEESPPEGMVLSLDAKADTVHKPDFVRSKMNKVALLASLTSDRLVSVLMRAVTAGAKDPATIELLMNALTHRIAAEAGFTASADEKSPFRGLPTLALLRDEIISKTSKQAVPQPSIMGSMVSRLKYLRTQEVPWYQRWFSIGRRQAVAAQLAEKTKAIEQHIFACYSKQERTLYNRVLSATSNYCSKSKSTLLDQLVERNPNSSTTLVSHNPYVSRRTTNSAEYARRFQQVEKQVAENILARSRLVQRV